jgi:serine/threonine-protein kinase HipA
VPPETRGYLPLLGFRGKSQTNLDTVRFARRPMPTDLYSVVKAEFIAMRLAALAGLAVASVSLAAAAHKDVLLVERFDRVGQQVGDEYQQILHG